MVIGCGPEDVPVLTPPAPPPPPALLAFDLPPPPPPATIKYVKEPGPNPGDVYVPDEVNEVKVDPLVGSLTGPIIPPLDIA
jgi:hypothetical protein